MVAGANAIVGAENPGLPQQVSALGVNTAPLGTGSIATSGTITAGGTVIATGGTNTVAELTGTPPGNPGFPNSATGTAINTGIDCMIYLEVTTVFVALVIKIGPTSSPAYTVFASAACQVGTLLTIRLPAGWFLSTSYTSGAFNQLYVLC
jgi:hypothetical protein